MTDLEKKTKVRQLVKDGIVQLKSLRQLKKQGILPKDTMYGDLGSFRNSTVGIVPPMYDLLGKVITVDCAGLANDCIRAGNWSWPLEAVKC